MHECLEGSLLQGAVVLDPYAKAILDRREYGKQAQVSLIALDSPAQNCRFFRGVT